jgi:PHD/YefM family antitoxin component YafN of YafNO toxin-antitoxin module
MSMDRVMPTMPVSDLRKGQASILANLDAGPILLTSRGGAAGVLVHPAQWNDMIEEMEDLQDVIAALKGQLALARGEETITEIDTEELKAQARHALPA